MLPYGRPNNEDYVETAPRLSANNFQCLTCSCTPRACIDTVLHLTARLASFFRSAGSRRSVQGAFKFAPSRHSRDIKWPGLASLGGLFLCFLAPGRPARHILALTQAPGGGQGCNKGRVCARVAFKFGSPAQLVSRAGRPDSGASKPPPGSRTVAAAAPSFPVLMARMPGKDVH